MASPNFKVPSPKTGIPPGVPLKVDENTPTLFTPFKLRDVTFRNRIFVAPMCMYSADRGHLTPFHFSTLPQYALRGAALTIIEATAVQPRGRISPGCPGLWEDAQIEGIRKVAEVTHSQGHHLGIQLAHAGRKASTLSPWEANARGAPRGHGYVAPKELGGWADDVWGPSELPFGEGHVEKIHAVTVAEIKEVIQAFADSAIRAVKAGVDVIEIHGAHGYLISSFLSPTSNNRTDAYGGSFENRVRILLEVCQAVRKVIPDGMPLFVRVSATEWVPNGWSEEDTIKLAKLLPGVGVDLLDVSSGGNNKNQKIDLMHSGYQVGIAGRVREALHREGVKNLAIGAVGLITQAEIAEGIVQGADKALDFEDEAGNMTKADVVLVARQFLKEPEWVLRVAHQLGVKVQWPVQFERAAWTDRDVLGEARRKEKL
jgi:2,4-dienoyl-CoA reductase-like NADH-dependent reductase (Old Yellow Enzyme family)